MYIPQLKQSALAIPWPHVRFCSPQSTYEQSKYPANIPCSTHTHTSTTINFVIINCGRRKYLYGETERCGVSVFLGMMLLRVDLMWAIVCGFTALCSNITYTTQHVQHHYCV